MDILVSSNLERLVFHATGEDPGRTAGLMRELVSVGDYSLSEKEASALSDFRAGWADEAAAAAAARRLYKGSGYLIDPHTAVAVAVLDAMRTEAGSSRPTLVASTASPFKFPASVARAIGLGDADGLAPSEAKDPRGAAMREIDLAERLARAAHLDLPSAVRDLRVAPEIHSEIIDAADMESALESALLR